MRVERGLGGHGGLSSQLVLETKLDWQPMWTATTRRQHGRAGLRYASDVTDAEWRILETLLPGPACRGRRWAWPLREIINAIFYVLRAGCAWRLLLDSFPP